MPRHGMAATGTHEPTAAPEPPRRPSSRGMSSWPIRRKLVALVAGPLIVILAAGSFITAQTVSELRDAQRSQTLASTALQANALSSRLQRELANTVTALASPTPARRQQVQEDRAATDQALQTLVRALAEPPTGGWGAAVSESIAPVQSIPSILPGTRERALPANPDTRPTLTPTTVQYSYSVLLEEPRTLLSALA